MSFRILKRCRIVFGLVSLLTLILFPSCQIGLGETVDTLPAEISFSEAESAPVSNAVIRGVFALGGNWSDDGKISEVKINISSNSTSSTASVSGTVIEGDTKGSGTWEAIIDPFKKTDSNPDGLGLLDGTYDFHVVIKDAAGHSTEISRSYVIDNTAPVLILSRPSSTELTDDNKIESYGQFLTIEGQAADDNDVNSLEINFYAKEAPETLLYTKVLTNIPPTISLDVATFLDEAAYTAIYGNEKNGEKSYYCTINAYDSAKRYPVAGEEAADDSKGNCESSYILWTDWEKALSDAGLSLKVPDLYHIKSGVYYTSSTDRSVDSDKVSNMWSTLMDKKISLSSFKLNPENSPTYSVSGLNLGIITNVENDSSLTVQLAKGLDGISLNTDSMKVYLQACDEAGNALQGSEKLYPTDSTYYQKGDGQFLTKIIKNKCLNASGQSVNLVYGNLYIIGVEGNDVSGNTIRPSFTGQNFLIRFKAKNIAPEVNIESPSETISYLKKGTSLRIKGTSAVPDGYPSITIKCKKGAADSEVIYSKTFTDADKVSATEYLITYAFDFTVAADSSGSYSFDQDESNQYVFDIISSLDEMTTAYTKTVLYDIDAPGIEIESMLPIASKYSDDEEEEIALGSYLNGDVTMKVSIIDDYDTVNTAKTYWSIISSKSPEATAEKHYFTTPAKENFVIKTAEVAGTEEMTVRIYAEDRAGNSRVYEKRYNVDQSTDYPLIRPYTPRSVTLKYDSYQDITDALAEGITKSVMIAGSPLQIKIMDDDGIKEALFLISERDSGENLHEPAGFNQTITGDPVEYIFSYSLPTITGRYKCSLEVKDINNKTSSKEFWIAVTSPAPVVTLESTSPQNKIITTASSNTINPVRSITNILHIDSGYDSFNVSKLESGCAPVTLTTREDNSHVFQDILTPSASRNANKVTYTVTDENLHSGERVFEYYVDSTPPSIDAASIVVPTNTQTHSTSFRFGAEAKDELTDANIAAGDTAASGVAKLQYYFAGYNNSGEEFGGSVITVSNVSSISESVIFAEYPALNESTPKVFATEGKKKFYVRAIDAVGNVCDWVSKEFMYDKAEPSVQISSYKRGSETAISFSENSASKSFETGYTFELSGTASDGNGIESFEIWQKMEGHTYSNVDGIKLTDISVSSLVWNENEKTYEWTVTGLPRNEASITESNLASGTYIYTVRATDKSAFGSQSAKISSQSVTVKIDKTKPTVTINLAENNSSDSSAYGENSIKGNAYTFRGTALDEPENSGDFSSGFNTLYYAFTTTESEPAHPFQGSVNPSTESWSFTMNLGTGSGTDSNDTLYEGKKYLWVYGIDKAGNISDTKHVAFMVDQAAPLISSLGVYKNEDTATTLTPDNGIVYITDSDASSYTLRGQASDANGISKVTVDGTEVAVSDDGSWSKNFTAQGSFIHKVIVYDGSGKTGVNGKSSEKNLSVIYDKVAPTSTIADLDSDSSSMNTWISGDYGSDYYINGSASDTGSSLKEILIKVDSAEYVNLPLSSNWSYKYQIPENFEENNITADSYHTVSVKVIDNANNESVTSAYFRYDKNRPEANLALNKDGLYVNEASFTEGITLSGYAHDGRGESSGRQIKSAKILVSKDGAEQSSMTMDIKTDSSYVTSVGNTYGNFSKTLSAADFTDGRYAFTLQVKDLAENSPDATSALTASFIVDKTAPANLSAKFLVTEDGNTSEVTSLRSNKSKARISVSFTEANPDAVYYYVNDGSNADITQENAPADDWVSMNISGSGSSWTAAKDCSFNDGCGQVYIKVVDKAGNIAYATALPYEVDTKKPDVCTLSTVDSAVLVGSKLINGSNDVVFKVNASDYNDNPGVANRNDVTKIASVNLYQIGSGSASIITASGSEIGSPTMSGSGDSAVKTGEWTITIPKSRFSGFTTGSYPVTVIVKDTFDHTKTFQLFTLDVDTGKPEIKSYSLENSYDAGLVGESGAQVRTFYMNNQKNTFELSGIAKDDREIDKVTLTLTGTVNGEAKTKTLESSESAWTFEIGNLLAEGDTDTSNAWKNWSGSVTASISVIDKAKNVVENPISFTIIFDNTPPAAKHLFDSNGKDLYFRLGDQDNDTVNDNLDKAVGQMYSSGAYGNKDTIKIRGNFDEGTNGSGLKMIYYMLTTSLDQASALKTSFDSNPSAALTSTSGYFVPKSENKRVYYTDSTYSGSLQSLASYTSVDAAANSYSTVITSDFSESITGFSEGKNYLVLLAEDNVGNLSIDTFTLPSADSAQSYYQINLDTLPPEITALTSEVYTNASEALTLSFTVVDKINLNDDSCQAAGIKSVTVNMGGVSEEKEASLGEDGKWSVTIPSNKLPNTSGSCSLSVTALDKAGSGNSVTQSVGSVIVDRDPPELGINDITDADTSLDNVQVNGTISISGTANDSYGLKQILGLCYKIADSATKPASQTSIPESGWAAPDGWTKISATLAQSDILTAWTYTGIDTSKLDGINAISNGSTVWISAAVEDKAGNVSYADPKKVIVDQNSDRPILKFSNLPWDSARSGGAGVKEYNKNLQTLMGNISDDDGISEFKVKISSSEITTRPADMAAVTVSSGSFAISLGDDGQKYIWIYIKDSKGAVFETKASSSLNQPYLIFDNHKDASGKDIRSDSEAVLNFAINSTAPEITGFNYKTGSDSTALGSETAVSLGTTNYVGGSEKKYVSFSLNVSSAVPVTSVKAIASGVTGQYTFSQDESNTNIWNSPAIDIMADTWAEGAHTITFTVEDASGLTNVGTKQITVDKTGPEVSLTSPGADDVSGLITLKGTASDPNNYSSVSAVGFAIVDNRYYSALGTLKDDAEENIKAAAKASVSSLVPVSSVNTWSYLLDGVARTVSENTYTNPALPTSESDVENTSTGINLCPLAHENNEDVRSVTIVFYAKDSLGNESYTPITSADGQTPISINFNPYGDRPSSTITYPSGIYRGANTSDDAAPTYVSGYSNVNGSIRVTGSASDNNSISSGKVFIQLDVNRDGLFNDADVTLLADAGYTIISDITAASNWGDLSINPSAVTYYEESKWGIAVSGTNSWSINLNSRDELKLSAASIGDDTGKYKIGVRSLAVDNTGVFGKWSESKYFMIDTNAPQITKSEIVSSTDATVSQLYSDDMYLKGTQYLKLTLKDKEGIKKLTYALADNMNSLGSPRATYLIDGIGSLADSAQTSDSHGAIVKRTGTADGYVLYNVFLPVSTLTASGTDSLALKVTAYKNADSELSTYERYSMSFDNNKPEIEENMGITFNGVKGDTTAGSMKNRLMNSNGQYFTLGGKIKDTGSGFERIAFYYYRDKQNTEGQKRRVYDMDPTGSVGEANRKVQVTEDSSTTLLSGITMQELSSTEESGNTPKTAPIYGYNSAVTISSDGLTLTLASESDNAHIRSGGLVRIAGFWHLISAKSGTSLTLSSATTATSETSAFFPIAQVIDNLGAEKTDSSGNLIAESGDDGDGMPESVVKSGSYWTFDASIHSNYIPDGPGNLVIFIWDKAGNLEVQKFTASVQNNAPRITKLWLGTDLTGSQTFSENAFTEYDLLTKTGTAQSSYEMATAAYTGKRFRIKGDLAVVAEFTGGNGSGDDRLKMALNSSAESESSGYCADNGTNMYSPNATLSAKDWFTHSTSAYVDSAGTSHTDFANFAYIIDKDKLGSDSAYTNGAYANREMSFTFWDKTEETTQGKDSCYSYLKLTDLIVMIEDNFAPTVAIDPFYWKSESDNSLAGYSYKNGHIELPTVSGATFELTTGMYKNGSSLVTGSDTNKPQVSGKISLRGSALDGHGLKSIWVAFTDNTGASVFTPANVDSAGTGSAYYKIAEYTASWVCENEDDWKCTILSDETTMEGQLVSWQLDIDTSKMTGGMGNDLFFKVMARDKSYTAATASSHQSKEIASGSITRYGTYDLTTEGVNQPSYKVDVVPYISDVYDENDLAANRSRLGRFPVRTGKTIKIKGFNFGSEISTVAAELYKSSGTKTADITAVRTDANTITITAPANSGYLRLKIGDTYASNAYQPSSSAAPYNIEAGYLSSDSSSYGRNAANSAGTNFWGNDRYLSVWNVENQISGSDKPMSGIIKKAGNTSVWRRVSDGYECKPETVNANNVIATWSATDRLTMYGQVVGNGSTTLGRTVGVTEASFYEAPPVLDTCIINGEPFYVLLDNYVGGDSANNWGAGLLYGREGWVFAKGQFSGASSQRKNFIEYQGSKNQENSSNGFDGKKNQFINPHITGYQDTNDVFHIWISYYDSYAHCLKYAAYTEKLTLNPAGINCGNAMYENFTTDLNVLMRTTDDMDGGLAVVAGYDTLRKDENDFKEEAGEYNDILMDGTTPVLIYYSKTKKSLEIARPKVDVPSSGNLHTTNGYTSDLTEGDNGWYKTKGITPNSSIDFGRYVSATIDSSHNLHITAQDVTNGKLYYGVFALSGNTYSISDAGWTVVDATSSVGMWTDIELDSDSKPVISYIDKSQLNTIKAVKVAYYDTVSNSFESMTDPAVYEAKDDKTSVVSNAYETKTSTSGTKLAVGFNSNMFAVDFLRGE